MGDLELKMNFFCIWFLG